MNSISTINISELRIGSWLNFNGKAGEVGAVYLDLTDSSNGYICSKADPSTTFVLKHGHVIPIPISPSLLEKMGFEYSAGEITGIATYNKGLIKLIVRDGAYHFSNFALTNVHYTHQLQNLYRALTNQEIDFKI